MTTSKQLPPSWEHPVAAAIREAIGADETERVLVRTPQFTRTPNMPDPAAAPAGWAAFTKLYDLNVAQLKALGCGNWDGGLFLFPSEWYAHIPAGFPVEDINGNVEPFEPGKSDDDIRFGCLPYGVRIGPATDGCDE